MKTAKIIQAFSSFSKADWTSFRKFILSKTGKDSEIFTLFLELQKRKNALADQQILDTIYKKSFHKKTAKVFSNMQSQLFQWCEEWLIIDQLNKDKYLPELLLLKSLNRRGNFKLADQTAKKLEKNILKADKLDLAKSKALSDLYHQQFYSDNPIKYKSGTQLLQNIVSNYLKSIKEQLILYTCELENWSNVKNIDLSKIQTTLATITAICPESQESELLLSLNDLIHAPTFEKLSQLKRKLFLKRIDAASDLHVIITMYLFVVSFTLLREGSLEEKETLFELYEYGFATQVLMNSGKIPETRFNNMINVLANMSSEQATEELILKWHKQVNTKDHDAIRRLALAQNKIYNNNFGEIRSLLSNFSFDKSENLRALAMLAIAYYEESEIELLHSHLENFERTLRRHKSSISKALILSYQNFIKLTKQLLLTDHKTSTINLEQYPYLIFRPWLIEKLG